MSANSRIKVFIVVIIVVVIIIFVLSDSKGNVVLELDRAKALETFVDLSYDDTYTMTAIYNEFTGKYSIKVSTRRY